MISLVKPRLINNNFTGSQLKEELARLLGWFFPPLIFEFLLWISKMAIDVRYTVDINLELFSFDI